jgi:RND superfamily putative drug exporter
MEGLEMTNWLHRLGGTAAAHPWRTLATWLLALSLAFGLVAGFGGTPHDDYDVPGMPAQVGTDLLRAQFPAASGAADRVVVHDREGEAVDPAVVEALRDGWRTCRTSPPSPRRAPPPTAPRSCSTSATTSPSPTPTSWASSARSRRGRADEATGLQVELGGDVPDSASLEVGGTGELVGISVALALLVLTFGSVLAAGVPILVAMLGLAVGSAGVLLLAAVMDVSTSAPTVATMVGLGVGIDYALLLSAATSSC